MYDSQGDAAAATAPDLDTDLAVNVLKCGQVAAVMVYFRPGPHRLQIVTGSLIEILCYGGKDQS